MSLLLLPSRRGIRPMWGQQTRQGQGFPGRERVFNYFTRRGPGKVKMGYQASMGDSTGW